MGFRYRLDRLLKLKQIDEDRAAERLAACQEAWRTCEAELEALLCAYTAAERALNGGSQARSAAEFHLAARHLA